MPIPKDIMNMIECCINNDGHYVKDAILLTCGANACKKCINELNKKEFKCFGCKKVHKIDEYQKLLRNPTIDILIEKIYLKDITQVIKNGFNETLKNIESKVNFIVPYTYSFYSNLFFILKAIDFEEQINKNVEIIEFEIDIKIESLKHQLDQVGDVFREKLKELKNRIW